MVVRRLLLFRMCCDRHPLIPLVVVRKPWVAPDLRLSIARVPFGPGGFIAGTFGRDDVSLPHSDGDSRTTTMSSAPFQRPRDEAPWTEGHATPRL